MSRSVRFRWALTAALFLIIVFVVALALRDVSTSTPATPTLPGQGAIDPRVIANLTQLPQATALTGQAANDLVALRALVEACPAYTDARREQMLQQIGFIINPAQLPRDIIIALGANPRGRLLFALVQVTRIQWQLDGSPADSCLLPIGRRINDLLAAEGEATEEAFAE